LQAVQRALTAPAPILWNDLPTRWVVLHVQSEVPGARYLTTRARQVLGYSPSR